VRGRKKRSSVAAIHWTDEREQVNHETTGKEREVIVVVVVVIIVVVGFPLSADQGE